MLPTGINLYVLIVLIFFVGIQLRNNGISLKEALFNKRGFQTGMVFAFTSLLGGIMLLLFWLCQLRKDWRLPLEWGGIRYPSVVLTNAWGPCRAVLAFF